MLQCRLPHYDDSPISSRDLPPQHSWSSHSSAAVHAGSWSAVCYLDRLWHIHRYLSRQPRTMASASGYSNRACCLPGFIDLVLPRGKFCERHEENIANRNSLPAGSSITTALKRACEHWLSCTLMATRMTLGCRQNMPKSRKASRSNTKTRPSRIWTCSPTALLSVDCSFAVLCRLLFR